MYKLIMSINNNEEYIVFPAVPAGIRGEPARGQVGQQVVHEHRQRREADGAAQVDRPDEDEHHRPDRQLGPVGHPGAHGGERTRQVTVPGHGEGRAGHAQQQ